MKWFTGDVGVGIQKAIQEKKVFIVFIKDTEESSNDVSKKVEELWQDEEVETVCPDDKCVAISITAGSLAVQQFVAIYPMLSVPSTYLINNQGAPQDIIPGFIPKEEFITRLTTAIQAIQSTLLKATSPPVVVGEEDATSSTATLTQPEKVGEEIFNDDMESELTKEEESSIEMLREKVKKKNDDEENKAQKNTAEQQAMSLAKEIAERKSEDKVARERVREQIRLDRLDKTKRFDQERKDRADVKRQKTEAHVEATAAEVEKKKVDASKTARLQFRLPDGSSVSNQFNAEAKFLVAETFIKDHMKAQNIRLTTVYPKHEFNSEDMVMSFRELGLVPNASIIVSMGRSALPSTSLNPMSFFMFVLSPIFAILNWFASLFTGGNGNQDGSPSVQQQRTPASQTTTTTGSSDIRNRNNAQSDTSTRGSNIQRLRRDEDDDNATWNGNSTQQM